MNANSIIGSYVAAICFLIFTPICSQNKLNTKITQYSYEVEKIRNTKFFIIPKLSPISRKELRKLAYNFIKKDSYVNTIIPTYHILGLINGISLKKIRSLGRKVFLEQTTAFFSPAQNTIYFNTHNIVKPLGEFRFGEKVGLTPLESVFIHELIHALDYYNFTNRHTSQAYPDPNVNRIINEGSAMFSLFLYAAQKVNQAPSRFIKDNLKHLPIHYNKTGYKSFDRLPEIIRYDTTLPYSLGPRLFYKLYKRYNLQAFKKIFSQKFCSVSNLIQYIYNSHTFCPTKITYNKKLLSGTFKTTDYITNFSDLNILSLLLLANNDIDYRVLKYLRSYKVFKYDNNTVLLILKLKNNKTAKKIYEFLYQRYGCRLSKCAIDYAPSSTLKSNWNFTGVVLNTGRGWYLVKAKTNIIVLSSYNMTSENVVKLWKNLLKCVK